MSEELPNPRKGTPTVRFWQSFALGGLAIFVALLLTVVTCMVLQAGITPGSFYVPPLLLVVYFLMTASVAFVALRRLEISKAGFLVAIALFILLDGFCWANISHM
jgi:FtsH-binding integral membrane protein